MLGDENQMQEGILMPAVDTEAIVMCDVTLRKNP